MTYTLTTIFSLIMMTSMITTDVDGFMGIPDNVNFVTELYNSSNCSEPSFKNFTLQHLCFKTKMVDGYPECCHDLLKDISVFENASLGQCIKTNMTQINRTGVRYDCNMTHLKQLTKTETLSYLGLISMVILSGLVFGCCIRLLCCGNKNSYNRV